jgi:RimJ/RimL family protein N-acetyltransferase
MALETEKMSLDPATVRLGVAAVLLEPAKGSYFVSLNERGDHQACLLTIPEWSDWRNGTVLWIHSVYVVPPARGKGVYKSMYAALKERVEADSKLRGLRLYVDRRNQAARKVYEKLGMSNEHYELYEWMK